jgi:hypothetical protein
MKYLDFRATRFADRLLESTGVIDGAGHGFTYGLNSRAFSDDCAAVGFEPIQVKHGHDLLLCPPNARSERRAKRIRSSGLSGADPRGLTGLRGRQGGEQVGNEGAQVTQAVRPRSQHDGWQ